MQSIGYVTIESVVIDNRRVNVRHTKCVDLDRGPAEALVMVGLAASLAEAREMGDADAWARIEEGRRIQTLLPIAKASRQRKGRPTITPAEEASQAELLETYRLAVVRVAAALIATPTLSSDAVPCIVERAVLPADTRLRDQPGASSLVPQELRAGQRGGGVGGLREAADAMANELHFGRRFL